MWPALNAWANFARSKSRPATFDEPESFILLQSHPGESVNAEARQLTLSGVSGPGGGNVIVTQVSPTNNLPTFLLRRRLSA